MKKELLCKLVAISMLFLSIGINVHACDCDIDKRSILTSDHVEFQGLTLENLIRLHRYRLSERWTFTIGENAATQYALDTLCGFTAPENWWVDARFDPCTPRGGLPEMFDWRDVDGVDYTTPVKNQGSCGSCWAFGTVAPLECNIKYHEGVTVDLSEQWLVSCNQDGWGCGGGWWAHDYHQWKSDPCGDTGAVLEEYFPYVAADVPCNCPYPHSYVLEDWAFIGTEHNIPSVDAIKQAILDYGPVSAAVYVNTAFQAYTGGIFNDCSNGQVNHAVTLVGWDDTQGSNGVWFLRNSWGTDWGEDGYMRIPYGCSNIGYSACYIVYTPLGEHRVDVIVQKITNDPALDDFDPIDEWWDARGGIQPEWYYRVGLQDDINTRHHYVYHRDLDDWWVFQWISAHTWEVMQTHFFYTDDTTVEISLKLMDDDVISSDDLADVSAFSGGGEDNDISDKRAAMYHGTYNLATNELGGDSIILEDDSLTTIGDGINNAKIWFQIDDTYEPVPDLKCTGSLSFTDIKPGETVNGDFTLENIGDPWSLLYWKIQSCPDWGDWIFIPESGTDLTPQDGDITVSVTIIAPNEKNNEFTGTIKVVNGDDPSDYEEIPISLKTEVNNVVFDFSLNQLFGLFPD